MGASLVQRDHHRHVVVRAAHDERRNGHAWRCSVQHGLALDARPRGDVGYRDDGNRTDPIARSRRGPLRLQGRLSQPGRPRAPSRWWVGVGLCDRQPDFNPGGAEPALSIGCRQPDVVRQRIHLLRAPPRLTGCLDRHDLPPGDDAGHRQQGPRATGRARQPRYPLGRATHHPRRLRPFRTPPCDHRRGARARRV